MSDSVYIGKKAQSLSGGGELQPISRVTIWYDDENAFTAGKDTGRTLEIDCPWATQSMANALLASLQGYVYRPFSAGSALMDPAAELGDGVTIAGIYSVLASVVRSRDRMASSDISAPAEEEIDHEYPYLSPQQRELARKVTLGAYYYGTRITRANGLEIVKTDGETEKSRVKLNSDVLAFYNDEGQEALYFDASTGTYKFTGVINVNDKFVVDKDGNLTLGGNIVFTGESSFTQVRYSTDRTAEVPDGWMEEWSPAWDNTSTEVWAIYSYNAGANWTSPILVQGKTGPAGADGSDANVDFWNIKAALQQAAATEKTFITADAAGAPNIYGGKIYGAEIYAGTGEAGYSMMTEAGFDVISKLGQHKIGLGLEEFDDTEYPYLILGAGSGSGASGSGLVKKFTTGLWIGDDSALGVNASSSISGTGLFVSFSSDTVYKVINGTFSEVGSGGGSITVTATWGY